MNTIHWKKVLVVVAPLSMLYYGVILLFPAHVGLTPVRVAPLFAIAVSFVATRSVTENRWKHFFYCVTNCYFSVGNYVWNTFVIISYNFTCRRGRTASNDYHYAKWNNNNHC